MRIDAYSGEKVPSTLGEYRDLVFALVRNAENPAVKYLDDRIAEQGRDENVLASDEQMRQILFPLMQKGPIG